MAAELVRVIHGFRPFWLALEPTVATVRNFTTGRTLARYHFDEGDGLVLDNPRTRVDWVGRLCPMGNREVLERRSGEVRALKARLANPPQPATRTAEAYQ